MTVTDLDRDYALRAAKASFESRIVAVSRHLRLGESMRMFAPDHYEVEAIAAVFAAFRERFVGRDASLALAEEYDRIKRSAIESVIEEDVRQMRDVQDGMRFVLTVEEKR